VKFRKPCGAQDTGLQEFFMTDKTAIKLVGRLRRSDEPAPSVSRHSRDDSDSIFVLRRFPCRRAAASTNFDRQDLAITPSSGRGQSKLFEQPVQFVQRRELDRHLALFSATASLLDSNVDGCGEGIRKRLLDPQQVARLFVSAAQ
jgi:hypothetical protein